MLDKEIIKNNFSRYAKYYDRYAFVQNRCALRLIKEIKMNSAARILDIGCGTGNYTALLRNKFPDAYIKAVDISKDMIEIAKDKLDGRMIEFIVRDAETISFNDKIDLISSNACFQWFCDLERALRKYKEALSQNGLILFSIFGPLTFYELNKSLNEVLGEDKGITASSFMARCEIEKILKNIFSRFEVKEEILKERYISLRELLKTIKYTGVKGNGIIKNMWTPRDICRIEEIYMKKFPASNGKDIIATYQIFFCRGTG